MLEKEIADFEKQNLPNPKSNNKEKHMFST
jgi:hypothetical protein